MKVDIIIEMASDGGFSCYMKQSVPEFALFGYGNSAAEAKQDMLAGFNDIKALLAEEGKPVPDFEFCYHYDMKSFFNYFDFLNISKVAQRAGINQSLMRKYAAGIANAGENQYLKLSKAVKAIATEMQATSF